MSDRASTERRAFGDSRPLSLALGALVLALPAGASAWCPTLTEGPMQPADFSECAPMLDRLPLYWGHRCTSISLSSAAPSHALSTDEVTSVLRRSLDQWQYADCGSGVTAGLEVTILADPNACTTATHNTRGPNVHTVVFIEDADVWSRTLEHAPNAFAVTYVWHDRNTGEIFDGDIELNGSRGTFMDCPEAGCPDCPPEGCTSTGGPVDLGNVLTHELGHYFGISHTTTDHRDATMWAQAPFGQITKRTLEPDDIDAICTTYPAGAFDDTCDPAPMGGLGLDCRAPPGCGCAAPGTGDSARAEVSGLLLALALLASRRSQRGRQA